MKTRQDPDIKARDGTQPKNHYAGLKKRLRLRVINTLIKIAKSLTVIQAHINQRQAIRLLKQKHRHIQNSINKCTKIKLQRNS